MSQTPFKLRPLAAAIGTLTAPVLLLGAPSAVAAVAAGEDQVIELIVVTATRRSASVQDVPLNIAAVGSSEIEQQGLTNLADIAAWVPGLHVVDQGSRGASRIVVRGLNADPSNASEQLGNDGGGMVATYVGEIPLYVDLKLNDLERVEVLLGPQGTLYGAGTMAGAIRYIPVKPSVDDTEVEVRGDVYTYSESEDPGADVGITINQPMGNHFALRANLDYLDDPGFIDYTRLVREVGVSNPDPDFTDRDAVNANLRKKEDANDEETVSGRVALRWLPTDVFDATLSYYFQFQDTGGRTISSQDAVNVGDYDSGLRVLEPSSRDNELFSLETTTDLGFAELTTATGYSRYDEEGQRDQTDLLITLDATYTLFPTFTAYTRELQNDDTFSQEIRLVSTGDGPLSWIVGGFYRDYNSDGSSHEFTPHYDEFLVATFPEDALQLRPDSLEYFNVVKQSLEESAAFGELSYRITDAWQVTVGARWYKYDYESRAAVDLPLLRTVFFGDPSDSIDLVFEKGGQNDDGDLWKFNTSYNFTDDVMAYLTVSEGYRFGSSNGIASCPDPIPPNQNVCALPGEEEYTPDQTTNYEIGVHSTLADGSLVLNGALFYVDWEDPQLLSATQVGLQPITVNGKGAESTGAELSFNWLASDRLVVRGSYSYSKAELSDDAPRLVPYIVPPGFQSTLEYEDGKSGDRLPGSPEHQATLFLSYGFQLGTGLNLDIDYGLSYVSDVLTQVAERGGGESLDAYTIHDLSLRLSSEEWSLRLYAQNLFDEYYETSARRTRDYVQNVSDIDGGLHAVRSYFHDVGPPLQVGLRMTWKLM